VSYGVEFEGDALAQLNGMPEAAFDALTERVMTLIDQPWDASVAWPWDNPAYRRTVFGPRQEGILSFRADDAAEVISIYDIVWAG
jgi:hypothetical protein